MRRALLPLLLVLAASATLAGAEEPCVPVKPCEVPDQGAQREAPADYASKARQLHDLLRCAGPVPAGLAPGPVKAYCARREKDVARTAADRAALQTLLQPLRPARVPSAVVYPLSGADLLGSLAASPDAKTVTLVSSVPCGDPRLLPALREPGRLAPFLDALAAEGARRLAGGGGEPRVAGGPGALASLLWALGVEEARPVGLRFLRVEPGGTLRYLGPKELAAMEQEARGGKGPDPYASCEIAFLRRGEPDGAPPRFVRNLRADLSDAGIAADPGPLAHLRSKGSFVAVLAAAGPLSGDGFTQLRALLLRQAPLVVTDGTGPTPDQLRAAGLAEERRERPGGKGTVAVARR